MSSTKKLPKPSRRWVAEEVAQLSAEVRVARPDGGITFPKGHLVSVIWSSKRWAEVETLYREPITEPQENVKFRIPTNALEDVT